MHTNFPPSELVELLKAMKLLVLFLSVVTAALAVSKFHFFPKIASDYLKLHSLNNGILFFCRSSHAKWPMASSSGFYYLTLYETSSSIVRSSNTSVIMQLNAPQVGVIFDLDCEGTGELFEKMSIAGSFNASYFWLMVADNFKNAVKLLSLQDINLDAEITLAIHKNDQLFELFDVYNPNSRSHSQFVVQPKGSWMQDTGFNLTSNSSKFERRSNLNGATFRATIIAHPRNKTLISFLKTDDKLEDVQSRYHYRLFEILQKRHNFR